MVQKWPFFQLFVFRQYRSGKCVLRYSTTKKKDFLRNKNMKFKKSRKWDFSKGVNPWFWSQNGHFSNFLFLGNIAEENVFYDILQQKNEFLLHKNKKLKMSRNWDFSKGVNPWFWSTIGHSSNFLFLDNIDQENVFYDILERKKAFLGYKKKSFKIRKRDFSKGLTHGFRPKMAIFPTFYF